MKILLHQMGLSDVSDIVGHREFLSYDRTMNSETIDILGLESGSAEPSANYPAILSSNIWTAARVHMLREMAGTTGKMPGEAEISSMGAVSAPFVESPSRISDWLVSDGAQVTRPSIDPYREEIEIFSYIPRTGMRLAAPFFFTHLPDTTPQAVKRVFARTAVSMGLLFDEDKPDESYSQYFERVISNTDSSGVRAIRATQLANYGALHSKTIFLRLPSSKIALEWVRSNTKELNQSISGIILDEDLPDSDSLEISVSQLDRILKSEGRRSGLAILAESNTVRGADDIFKLLALGADLVGLGIGCSDSDRFRRVRH